MIISLWMLGTIGYYSALVIWIVAQRTHYFHGRYSHSWMIGTLLMIFGTIQIAGSLGSEIVLAGMVALIMPLTVTLIDVKDHRREGRGVFEHHPACWMEQTHSRHEQQLMKIQPSVKVPSQEDWSSR
jgi:hypothetical protein